MADEAMTCNEFKNALEAQFGKCEFCATSHQGHIISSKGWQDKTYKVEVTPLIPRKNK